MPLIDRYRRRLNYLRISITDRCNLGCIYCDPSRITEKLPHREILRYEELLRIIGVGIRLGITKVRVTGGEPLVRKGCCGFLRQLGKFPELADISLTTNGILLKSHLDEIAAAGIQRLNISLDTLDRQKYRRITGTDAFNRVMEAVMSAHEKGFAPIKINAVVLSGINTDELSDLAKLSLTHPFHVRFIEYMPIGGSPFPGDGDHMLFPRIFARLAQLGPLVPVPPRPGDGPALRYRYQGAPGEIGFINPISRHFCAGCNRLRITADGRILPCLLSSTSEDLKTPLRSGCTDGEIAAAFLRAVDNKPVKRPDVIPSGGRYRRMVSIGG